MLSRMLDKILSRRHIKIFSYFSQKRGFDITWETICMKCQNLFSGINRENVTNLWSAELAQRVVKVKCQVFCYLKCFSRMQMLIYLPWGTELLFCRRHCGNSSARKFSPSPLWYNRPPTPSTECKGANKLKLFRKSFLYVTVRKRKYFFIYIWYL